MGYNPFTNHLLTSWDIQVEENAHPLLLMTAHHDQHHPASFFGVFGPENGAMRELLVWGKAKVTA